MGTTIIPITQRKKLRFRDIKQMAVPLTRHSMAPDFLVASPPTAPPYCETFSHLPHVCPLLAQSPPFFPLWHSLFWHLLLHPAALIAPGSGSYHRQFSYCDIHYALGCQGWVGWSDRLKGVFPPHSPIDLFLESSQRGPPTQLLLNGMAITVLLWL